MSNVWNYRDTLDSGDLRLSDIDIVGYDVEATDGSIGTIDAATYDTDASSIVVDTGWWIFGKKRVIPAAVINQVNAQDEKVFLGITKEEVKGGPDFDDTVYSDRDWWGDDDYRSSVGNYYGPFTQ